DTAALVVASSASIDPQTGAKPDRLDLASRLETGLRQQFSDGDYELHLVGVPTVLGDIANGVKKAILVLFPLAVLILALLLHAWTRCWRLALLPLGCSLVSLVWQFGLVGLLGFGLDPLTLVIPFLVFALGAAHGIPHARSIAQ